MDPARAPGIVAKYQRIALYDDGRVRLRQAPLPALAAPALLAGLDVDRAVPAHEQGRLLGFELVIGFGYYDTAAAARALGQHMRLAFGDTEVGQRAERAGHVDLLALEAIVLQRPDQAAGLMSVLH